LYAKPVGKNENNYKDIHPHLMIK